MIWGSTCPPTPPPGFGRCVLHTYQTPEHSSGVVLLCSCLFLFILAFGKCVVVLADVRR